MTTPGGKGMKRYIFLFWILFLPVLFYTCSKDHSKEILHNAGNIVNQYPDSALTILRGIGSTRSLSSEELAHYAWIKGLAHDKKNSSLIEDSLLIYALDFYKTHENRAILPSLYELTGKYYYAQKDYDAGDKIWSEGIEWAKGVKDSVTVSKLYHQRAVRLIRLSRDLNNAEQYLKNSLRYKENAAAYYMLAGWFAGIDSILYFGEKSVELALQNKDTLDAAFYLRNIAGNLATSYGKYEEAKAMLQDSLIFRATAQVPSLTMTYLYLQMGQIDSAITYLNETKNILNLLRTQGYQITMPAENSVAMAQAIIDFSRDKKYNYSTIIRHNDSVFLAVNDQYKDLQAKTESIHNLEKENMQLIINQQQSRLWFMAVILLILIIGGITFVFIRNRRHKLLEAQENIETLNRLLKEVTENPDEENDSHFFKKILLQQLGLIRLVAAVPTSANQELLRQMSEISNNDIPADALLAWDDLYPIIDSVYDNFYSNLKNRYGALLNEKEIQLCCLLCADFSTKEIQVVTQQSIPTIYQRKTTIRKKLRIEEKEDIISFLNQCFMFKEE